jgi:DNA helicase-2/ATP-dependent DNA helicase PcrA
VVPDATPDRILAGCDDAQVEAITTPAAPLLVVAAAGAGKTRVLTRRIAWRVVVGGIAPERALALTFTRKAAHELRTRLSGIGLSSPVPAGTFHAVALSELRRRALDTGRAMPVVADDPLRLLDPIAPRAPGERRARREVLRRYATEIAWAKARRLTPEAYPRSARAVGRSPALDLEEIAEVYTRYEITKRKKRVLDVDDLLERLTEEIANDPDFAAASRWRFSHLFVDELQDANPAQLALLDSWIGPGEDVFAVGDARQSIYGWNGADPEALERFAATRPGTRTIALTTNYRSTQAVVAAAAAVLGAEEIRAARTDEGPVPTVLSYPDGASEATGVAQAIALLRQSGLDLSDFAVLARTNRQLEEVANACTAAGIALHVTSARPFLERPTVSRLLRPIARSFDPGSFTDWIRSLQRRAIATDAGEGAPTHPSGEDDEALLLEFAEEYGALDPAPTGDGFLRFLRESADDLSRGSGSSGVDLLTFHRAKGLEWTAVFVIGLEDGYVPLAHASTAAQRAEEQRLLYVAMTRAREILVCSWAMTRTMRDRSVDRSPSPFLLPVEVAIGRQRRTSRTGASAAVTGLAASRAALARRPTR